MAPRTAARIGRRALTLGITVFLCLMGSAPAHAAAPSPSSPLAAASRIKLSTRDASSPERAAARSQSQGGGPLVYQGGAVQNVPSAYLSFWGEDWTGAGYQAAISYLEGFFGNVGGSGWLGMNSQYCSGAVKPPYTACPATGVSPITNPVGQLKGIWTDRNPVTYNSPPAACGLLQADPGDCDVIMAAQRAARNFGPLPAGAVIIVATPSGRSQQRFGANWYAYHWATTDRTPFAYVPYQPDAGSTCGQNAVNTGSAGYYDGFGIVAGHEYAEAITDPYVTEGWIDSSGYEIGDKCAWNGLTDIPLAGRNYAVQPLWSNLSNACATQPPAAPPTGFSSLHGTATSAPAAAAWAPGRLDAFIRGTDGALWHCWWDGSSWGSWQSLGGQLTSEPTVAAWGPNRLDVFVRGTDNALWHRWWDGSSWGGWERLGGQLSSGPTAASWAANRLDVFAAGTDNGLWHRWWDGSSWNGWQPQGGTLSASPAAASWAPNRIDVFIRGSDNALWHRWWDGSSWSGWEYQGGSLSAAPSVAAKASNRLDLIVRNADGTLSRKSWTGSAWTSLSPLNGSHWSTAATLTSQPTTSTLDVFAVWTDNAVWHASLTG